MSGAVKTFEQPPTVDRRPLRAVVSLSVFSALPQLISKITVTGALHDCLRPGELHVGTKTLLAILAIEVSERLSDNGVGSLLAQFQGPPPIAHGLNGWL